MTKLDFSFIVSHHDTKTQARTGVIHTPHGDIKTPAFIPVGTQGTVKSLTPEELTSLDVPIYFVNTYHMMIAPGVEVIQKHGGLHEFMHWELPVITDSGGFQVFSLGRKKGAAAKQKDEPLLIKKSKSDGVIFRSHWDGAEYRLNPEISMEAQWKLGSDIHIAFDDCTTYPVSYEDAAMSMELTHHWATRSIVKHQELADLSKTSPYQALYGSIQGSTYEDLRKQSARFISELPTDGIAIGGVSVGECKEEMTNVLDWVVPLLPEKKPRHLLGVGEVDDIFMLVEHGMDTFDCVQPTRLARMGYLYTKSKITSQKLDIEVKKDYIIDINKSMYKDSIQPVDETCNCYACTHFSVSYLHHLCKTRELLAYRLATIHNIAFYQRLVHEIRRAIESGMFLELKKEWLH